MGDEPTNHVVEQLVHCEEDEDDLKDLPESKVLGGGGVGGVVGVVVGGVSARERSRARARASHCTFYLRWGQGRRYVKYSLAQEKKYQFLYKKRFLGSTIFNQIFRISL